MEKKIERMKEDDFGNNTMKELLIVYGKKINEIIDVLNSHNQEKEEVIENHGICEKRKREVSDLHKCCCHHPHADCTLFPPSTPEWEIEFDEKFMMFDSTTHEKIDNINGLIPTHKTIKDVKNFISSTLKAEKEKIVEENKLFILNVLDGIDIADEEMGNKGGGTKAIRLAFKSRGLI